MREKITDKITGVDKLFITESDIMRDNNSDNSTAITSDISGDNANIIKKDKKNDINSDINSDMYKPKKQPKYTDLHERRTHYITKENVKFIEGLYARYNQDKSETVNRALNMYREYLKNNSGK